MTDFWPAFETIVNFLQGLLFAYMGTSIFDSKPKFTSNHYYFLSIWFSCGFLLTVFIHYPLPSMFLDILIIVSVFILLTLIFRGGTIFDRVFWSLMYFVMFTCATNVVMSIATSLPDVTMEFLHSSTSGRLIYVIAVNVVIVSLTFVFIRLVRLSVGGAISNIRVILASTILILSNLAVLLLLLHYASIIPDGLLSPIIPIASSIAIFVANTLVIWMFQHISIQNTKVIQLSAVEQRIELQARHQEQMRDISQDLSKFRHDTHQHFGYLLALAERNETKQIESYLRIYVTEIDKTLWTIETGNATMNAILNVKSNVAKHESVHFDVEAMLPSKLPMSDNDLVIIMGNILDNAIEASRHVQSADNRYVKVFVKVKGETLTITVVNTMNDKPRKRTFFSLTDRFKGDIHGMGLSILNHCVSRYGGFVNARAGDQNCYETSVIIPMVKKLAN